MPSKRQRDAEEMLVVPQWTGSAVDQREIFEKRDSFVSAKSDEQFDVDVTILDYLLYQASNSLLQARKQELDHQVVDWECALAKLEMVQSWSGYMQSLLGESTLPDTLSDRLRLLQMITLFTRRLHRVPVVASEASLKALRRKNTKWFAVWKSRRNDALCTEFDEQHEFPLPIEQSMKHRAAAFRSLCLDHKNIVVWCQEYCESSRFINLRDLLPLFLDLTVARAYRYSQWDMTDTWMYLAAEWMLQATLESYLLLGKDSVYELDESFAFGALGDTESHAVEESLADVQSLFCTDQNLDTESPTWTKIRREYLEAVLPLPNGSSVEAMLSASEEHPVLDFEIGVLAYLESLHKELPKPDLQQVEDGKIDGLTKEESDATLSRMGVIP